MFFGQALIVKDVTVTLDTVSALRNGAGTNHPRQWARPTRDSVLM